MIARAKSLEVGDRVKLGERTGIIELIVSDVFIIKWDWKKDCSAYTRDAVEKQFSRYNPRTPTGSRSERSERSRIGHRDAMPSVWSSKMSPPKPLHDPVEPPEHGPPNKPLRDPTYKPPQPMTEPTPNPAGDPPPSPGPRAP
jgi:hypothetical protein